MLEKILQRQLSAQEQKGVESRMEGMSRRDFLKVLGIGAAQLAVSEIPQLQRNEGSPQSETEISPLDRVLYIDMAPGYDNDELAQRALGSRYRDIEIPTDPQARKNFLAQGLLDSALAPNILLTLFLEHFNNHAGAVVDTEFSEGLLQHGELVTQTSQEILRRAGWETSAPDIIPLQDMLTNFEFGHDEEGVPFFSATIDETPMLEGIRGSSASIINMSFQLGEFRTTLDGLPTVVPENYFVVGDEQYFTLEPFTDVDFGFVDEDGNPLGTPVAFVRENGERREIPLYPWEQLHSIPGFTPQTRPILPDVVIKEPYRPETAHESFTRLIRLCRAFPEKLFVGAAGNYNSFSFDQKQALADEWPENLLLTGLGPFETNSSAGTIWPGNNIADIYIPRDFGNTLISSSESAAVLSALASVLEMQHPDWTPVEIIHALKTEFCRSEDVQGRNILFLDPTRYEPAIQRSSVGVLSHQ